MSLREQPYLPLYVQDFLTDEKLVNCSAESTGVYIRLMCLMHKSEQYGKILLRQKWRQSDQQTFNFAVMLARQMPYGIDTIAAALTELLEEDVIQMDGDVLYQKRMVKDAELSDSRAKSGKKGAEKSNKRRNSDANKEMFAGDFAAAKTPANTENEIEYENENDKKRKEVKDNQDNTFDTFWETYPSKAGEIREAFIEYKNAVDSGTNPETLLQAAKELAKRYNRETRRYIPSAEKWLRNKGWLDKTVFPEPDKPQEQRIRAFTPIEEQQKPPNLSEYCEWPPGSGHIVHESEIPKHG